MQAEAVIVSAGAGRRLSSCRSKNLLEIQGMPVIVHTVRAFDQCQNLFGLIVVVPVDQVKDYERLFSGYTWQKPIKVVTGSSTRARSVQQGVMACQETTDVVMIHDGARPLINTVQVTMLLEKASQHDAIILGAPVKGTIKRISEDGYVQTTIDRSYVWEIQTPQVFKKALLLEAYRQVTNLDQFTDEAMLLEHFDHPIHAVKGDYQNIKITTPEDLVLADVFLRLRNVKTDDKMA